MSMESCGEVEDSPCMAFLPWTAGRTGESMDISGSKIRLPGSSYVLTRFCA